MLLTFGLLSPGKGIEYVIQALPEIVRQYPDLIYIVLGATHPHLVRAEGESYRLSLERLAEKLGMTQHVAFYNRFVELEERSSSSARRTSMSPPISAKHRPPPARSAMRSAVAKRSSRRPTGTPRSCWPRIVACSCRSRTAAIATAVCGLLADEARLDAMRERAYRSGRGMIWSEAAHHYFASFRQARGDHRHHHGPRFAVKTLAQQPLELPELTLDHVERLTDLDRHLSACGLRYAELRRRLLHGRQRPGAPAHGSAGVVERHAGAPAACDEVFRLRAARLRPRQPALSQLHGFRSPLAGRDGFRRLLRALSVGVGRAWGRSKHRSFQKWAAELFLQALPELEAMSSPRAWAFGLIGAGIPRAFERRPQRQRHQRQADRKAYSPVRGAKRGGLAVV